MTTLQQRLRHPVGCTLEDRIAAADLIAKQAEAARDAMRLALDALKDERYVSRYSHIVDAIAALEGVLK